MSNIVTEDELQRARSDPEFRHQLLAHNLERLLEALNEMRKGPDGTNPETARQIREGVDLAVKLADRLQQKRGDYDPQAA
jgi:hypothetical protein